MTTSFPFISMVTPVYNGEQYLAECIDSVLAQTHDNWEYIILDNCSTDATPSIVREYARKDSRICVHTNAKFLGLIDNHNKAFRLISPDSRYCKVISADDWIYPDCVTKLVEVAEKYSSVGVVGSYAIKADGVRGLGLSLKRELFHGHEVCRLRLLGMDVIGSPSSLLYRTSLVRAQEEFFVGSAPNADTDAIFRILRHSEFGFVHQVLSFERIHEKTQSARLMTFNSFLVDQIQFLVTYGPIYLNPHELAARLKEVHRTYYEYLAAGVVNFRDREFWHYHKKRMRDIGLDIDRYALSKAILVKTINLMLNPKQTIEKALRRINKFTVQKPD
jgi:glycosyltransferase involved in cell wall biosynthesis